HPLLGLHRFIKTPLGCSPGATRMARPPSGVLPAPLGLLQLRIRFDRRLALPLDAVPPPLAHPLHLALRVQDIATHGERGRRLRLGLLRLGLLSLTASGLGQFDPARKSLAPSGHAMLQGRPRFDDLPPALAATIRPALSRQPSSAQRCNAQQAGLAMTNAFVQPPHQHPALASPLQDLPDATRLLSALLH